MKSDRIVLFPEPVLRRAAAPVTRFDENLKHLVDRMDALMRAQKHGIGIAAPQIGVSLQVALVDVSARIPDAKRIVLVNPRLLEHSDEKTVSREGCMSLPEYTADLYRWQWVDVKWQDETGKTRQRRFEGIEGICVQHEMDHLQGKLFLDRVACLKTDMIARHLKKNPFKQ